MKWLFRITGLVIGLFIALCVAGAFMPAVQRVDHTEQFSAEADEIYALISDLRSYPAWSGIGGATSQWVFGGAETGVGQTAAWVVENDDQFGSLEIVQAEENEYVRLKIMGPLGEQTVTLALDEGEANTIFVLQAERQLGGFPYLGRIAALRQAEQTQTALEQATSGLAKLFG